MVEKLVRKDIQKTNSYRVILTVKKYMDEYYIDSIIGLFPIVGDIFTQILSIPFLYFTLFKVRSIPLTLAVLFNILIDALVGMIPFFIGNILDFLYRSYKNNFELIIGFISNDQKIVRRVNKYAIWMVLGITLICYFIYLIISIIISLTEDAYSLIVKYLV